MVVDVVSLYLAGGMKDWYGAACLFLGVVLIVGAVVAGYREVSNASQLAKQAKVVGEAATQVETVANRTNDAISEVRGNLERMDEGDGRRAVASAVEALEGDEATLKEAAESAKQAEEKAKDAASFYGVLNTVAAKSPLAAAGILMILLGAAIMGYIKVTVGA